MKSISQNRKPRSVFRLDPPSYALPPKKSLSLTQNLFQPRSSSTSIILCQSHCSSPTKHTRSIAYLMPPIDPIENP